MTDRPIGVFLLSILLIIFGGLGVATTFWMMFKFRELAPLSDATGITGFVVVFSLFLVAMSALAGGVGMILGTRWGWYSATFYYVYSTSLALSALSRIASQGAELGISEAAMQGQYLKYTIRTLGSILIVLYLCRHRVKESLDAGNVNSARAISIMIGICGAVGLLVTGVNFILMSFSSAG